MKLLLCVLLFPVLAIAKDTGLIFHVNVKPANKWGEKPVNMTSCYGYSFNTGTSGTNGSDGSPAILGPQANGDPWIGGDTWSAPDDANITVVDHQNTETDSPLLWAPGCANNTKAIASSECVPNESTPDGKFSFDIGKILAVRYEGQPGTNIFSNIEVFGPSGTNALGATRAWLTTDLYESFDDARQRNEGCAIETRSGIYNIHTNIGEGNPHIKQCVVKNERYYLKLQVNEYNETNETYISESRRLKIQIGSDLTGRRIDRPAPPIINNDPWIGTGTPNWWVTARSDGSKVYVFDQGGSDASIPNKQEFVPGCLNYRICTGSSDPQASETYSGITTTGATDTFAFDGIDSDSNTLAIRYVANDRATTHPGNYLFHLAGSYGGGIISEHVRMWLSQNAHETYEAAQARNEACAVAGAYLDTFSTSSVMPFCPVIAGERYYLLLKAHSGSNFQLQSAGNMEGGATNMGNPPRTGDPWKGLTEDAPNWWITTRTDGQKVYVFDHSIIADSNDLNYVPGCLNYQGYVNSSDPCHTGTYTGITTTGISDTFAFDGNKIAALRFQARQYNPAIHAPVPNPGVPGDFISYGATSFVLYGPFGGGVTLNSVHMWLSENPHETWQSAQSRNCYSDTNNIDISFKEAAGLPGLSPDTCKIESGKKYYYMIQTKEACNTCRYQFDNNPAWMY